MHGFTSRVVGAIEPVRAAPVPLAESGRPILLSSVPRWPRSNRTIREGGLNWRLLHVDSVSAAIQDFDRIGPSALALLIDADRPEDIALVERFRERHPALPLIALIDSGSIELEPLARTVLELFDACLPTRVELDELLGCAESLRRMAVLRSLRSQAALVGEHPSGLHGRSPAMRQLRATLDKVKVSDAPVLIIGETGTGKELVARAIHQGSGRSAGPLISLNCGAIPASLIQSELFGHEKNAFTGAQQRRVGSFEAADRGSVFLDEIGELPLALQPALLRVLQERSVTRVGSTRAVPVDFRLIAATHVDLPAAVASGRFREDLLYRVNVLSLFVPPLRERDDDVILLAERFREAFKQGPQGVRPRGFSRSALQAMRQHRWPGNVRELLNRVQRAVLMADGRSITPGDLGFDEQRSADEPVTLADARSDFERRLLRDTLHDTGHCVANAARRLGVSRVTLYRMIDRLGLGDASSARVQNGQVEPHPPGSPGVSKLQVGRFNV